MLKGGVIMDVVTPEEARIAEEAGAVAVMALERVPADIRRDGGVARMSDPSMIKQIKEAVTIPVMAKARIGHFVEAQILEALGIDYIDESEVLTPADDLHHINKHNFKVPFVCGCRDLGEALRRIAEGAAMIRTKGEAGTGNVVEAVRHTRAVQGAIRSLQNMDDDELYVYAKEIRAPIELVRQTKALGRLPVVNFAAGGVATPADAALMMQLGCDGVFVGSGIFKSGDPSKRARAIVQAVTHYNDAKVISDVSCGTYPSRCPLALSSFLTLIRAHSRPHTPTHAHSRPLTPTHAHSRSFTRSWRGYDRHRCEGKGVHELRRPKRVVVRRWTTPTTMGVFSQEINSLLSFFNVQVNPRYLCQFQGAFSYAGSSRFDVDVALRPWARPRQTQQENPSET